MADCYIRKRTNQPSAKQEQPHNDDLIQHPSRTLPAAASAVNFATQPDSVKQCVTAAKDLVVKI